MLIRIESNDNSRIRLIRKLQTRKGRTTEGRFVAEGMNLVSEAVRRGMDIDFVLIPESRLPEDLNDGSGDLIAELALSPRYTLCVCRDAAFDKITNAENGIGMLAVVRMPDRDISHIYEMPEEQNVLVLDRVQDPGNIGTMIRTAVAAGYGMIIAVKGTADIWSAKVLRATAGMIFDIPFVYVGSAGELCSILRKAGRSVVVTDPAGGVPYYEADLRGGIALVIGNEGNGISDELMSLADIRVTLPMRGDIESLNAAVSAAILMYEAVRNQK